MSTEYLREALELLSALGYPAEQSNVAAGALKELEAIEKAAVDLTAWLSVSGEVGMDELLRRIKEGRKAEELMAAIARQKEEAK